MLSTLRSIRLILYMNKSYHNYVKSRHMLATWPKRLKRRFYGDRVITIAWSRFSSHPHRARCCALG